MEAISLPNTNLDIAGEFLSDTLIHRVRVRHRKGTAYHAVNQWRSPLKAHQISAMKLVKKYRPPIMLELIARQMCDASEMLFGGSFAYVTNVACGHSGSDCFARQLAQVIASTASVEFIKVFDRIPVERGSSHPRKNIDRPIMQIATVPRAPILLIDDIASSGSHICEATQTLRQRDCIAFPIAWIAS